MLKSMRRISRGTWIGRLLSRYPKTSKYNFIEAIALGQLDYQGTAKVVRKDGKIYDFVLDGEEVRPHEIVTVESMVDIISEISNYDF